VVMLCLVMTSIVLIGTAAAGGISGHRGDRTVLWAAFALAVAAGPVWPLDYYRCHTIRTGHRPSDRVLRTIATSEPRRSDRATARTLAVIIALIGPSLVGTLAYHAIDIGAPVLGFLDGLIATFAAEYTWLAWSMVRLKRADGNEQRSDRPVAAPRNPLAPGGAVLNVLQLVASTLLGLYATLVIVAGTVGHHKPIVVLPAALVAIALACLLKPLRPRLLRIFRKGCQ